jgi:hypothetical protein
MLSIISNTFDSQCMKLEKTMGKTQIILGHTILNKNIKKEQALSECEKRNVTCFVCQ